MIDAPKQRKIEFCLLSGLDDSAIDFEILSGKSIFIIHGSYLGALPPNAVAIPVKGVGVPYGVFYRKNDKCAFRFLDYIKKQTDNY